MGDFMQMYREWAQKVNSRKGIMILADHFELLEKSHDAGYMSVFMFDEAAAKEIRKSQSSKGFARYTTYSNCIYIDIDTGSIHLQKTTDILMDKGLAHEVYFSGSKGYHIVVPLDRMYSGTNVPYSQLQWVQNMGFPGFDPSIYKASALISLPGRKHPKTGVKKTLINRVFGKPATLPLYDPPTVSFKEADVSDQDALRVGVAQLSMMTECPPSEGNRHGVIWKCAKSLCEAGVEFSSALDILQRINESWSAPKQDEEVERAVGGAYNG